MSNVAEKEKTCLDKIRSKIANRYPGAEKRIFKDAGMAEYSTFRAGGKAEMIFLPENKEELIFAISNASIMSCKYTVIGRGSNILVSDKGIPGLTIIIGRNYSEISLEESDIIRANAGAMLSSVANFAYSKGLTGLEFAAGIPGTIGGAIYMNAGAYDGCMSDVVIKTLGFDPFEEKTFTIEGVKEHSFSYRNSRYAQEKMIVLDVWMKLEKGDKAIIRDKMNDFSERRQKSQPLDLPSAGSTFKRPKGYYAGKLIEDSGLKGYRVGGACVCEKHAGFIVNDKNATAKDIYELIRHVQITVKEKYGVMLETEVRLLGDW